MQAIDSQSLDKLRLLWIEHLSAPFPQELRGECIGDHDAVMLDADIAGCVSVFLDSRGRLDERRVLVLRQCYQVLAAFLPSLGGYSRSYYERLKMLAELVLEKHIPMD